MFLFGGSDPFLGLDIGSNTIKLALLRSSARGSHELLNFGLTQLEPGVVVSGEIEDSEELTESIKSLLKAEKIPKHVKQTVFTIPSTTVIIRKITVPLMSEDDLLESIQQEAEQYIPFDIDEVNVDFQIVSAEGDIPKAGSKTKQNDDRQMDILLVAAKKEVIKEYAEAVKAAGLVPMVVDLDVFALENAFQSIFGLDVTGTVALINIGATVTNINILQNGVTGYTKDNNVASQVISELIQRKLGMSFKEAEMHKLGHLQDQHTAEEVTPYIRDGLRTLTSEINKTFELFARTSDAKIERIYLAGGGAMMEGIEQIISADTNINCEVINPFQNLKINRRTFDESYLKYMAPAAVIALGLALRRDDDKN
ncbi:MAG: type IV pilus assembly protein PilM [Nitrospinota bacterium]